MQAYYRNKRTGEIRQVEQDSNEMFALQREVDYNGHPAWEQTSWAHASDIKEHAKFGELREQDLGHDDQDAIRGREARLAIEGVGPEVAPHKALTPGEIEAGLTPQQKDEDLAQMFDQESVDSRGNVFEDASDRIADEREERPAAQQAKGLRARAGGSDEREGVPVATAKEDAAADQSPSGSSEKAKTAQTPAAAATGQGG